MFLSSPRCVPFRDGPHGETWLSNQSNFLGYLVTNHSSSCMFRICHPRIASPSCYCSGLHHLMSSWLERFWRVCRGHYKGKTIKCIVGGLQVLVRREQHHGEGPKEIVYGCNMLTRQSWIRGNFTKETQCYGSPVYAVLVAKCCKTLHGDLWLGCWCATRIGNWIRFLFSTLIYLYIYIYICLPLLLEFTWVVIVLCLIKIYLGIMLIMETQKNMATSSQTL